MSDSSPSPDLLDILASLNEIGATVNHLGQDGSASVDSTLDLIVQSAARVVPGASAVIYTYEMAERKFTRGAGISPFGKDRLVIENEPRADGLGQRAITLKRRVLSYEETDISIHPDMLKRGAKVLGCYPLIVADSPVGALYIFLQEERKFSQLELLMLDNFVNQAAMAIYHAHNLAVVQHDLARKEDELVRLRRAGWLISSRLRLEETLESILQMAMQVTGAHYGIFRLLDKAGRTLNTRAVAGENFARPLVEALPLSSNSVMAWVARNRQPVLIPDLREQPWSQIYYPLDASLEMRSELAVPLIGASGSLEGVLNLESPLVSAFNDDDSHLLQALATQAVVAIQEVTLLDATQEITHLLLTQPCAIVLDHLANMACDLLGAASSVIWAVRGVDLVLASSYGGYTHDTIIPINDSLAGLAVRDHTVVTSQDLRTDQRFHRADLARSQDWSHALVVPLLPGNDQDALGAFSVYSSETDPGRFAESEWDLKVLTCLADYAVLAYQNESHQESLRNAQEQRSIAETFAAVGDVASNLLHHLNNKVGTIPVRIQGIEDKCPQALADSTYLAHNLSEIERCASEAMSSVQETLSQLRPIRLEPVDVAACINAGIQSLDLAPSILIQTEIPADLPMVLAASQTLSLVFTNLIDNAVSAMDSKGTLSFSASVEEKWVKIAVRDTGTGIDPRLHEHIFELNYSGPGAARPGKLGFGLWWVKTHITRLNGTITVESDGIHGTTFFICLPRAPQPEAQVRDP